MNKFTLTSIILVVFCGVMAYVAYTFPIIKDGFRENLFAELISTGILGFLITWVFRKIDSADEIETNKQKAKNFLANKLKWDLRDAHLRDPSLFNINGGNKFYFDGTRINYLYDTYGNNVIDLTNYTVYAGNASILEQFQDFYAKCREGYILGEKLDNLIKLTVRSNHHKNNLISANDFRAISYIKAQVMSLNESQLNETLGLSSTSDLTKSIYKVLLDNSVFSNLVTDIKACREDLYKISTALFERVA